MKHTENTKSLMKLKACGSLWPRVERRVPLRLVIALLLALIVAGCNIASTPTNLSPQKTNPKHIENVQPPTLPIKPATKPLSGRKDKVPRQKKENSLKASAALSSKVQMRLLLISPTADDLGLQTLKTLCDQIGALCDTFISSTTPMTQDVLVDTAEGEAKYQGIFLTNNELAYSENGAWTYSFDATEWNTLWDYELDYKIRQVSLYGFPGAYPEPQGLTSVDVAPSTGKTYYNTSLTPDGQSIFSTLKTNAPIPIQYAYTYRAQVDPTVPSTKPLIHDAAGNLLAATSTSPDGRERLILTMAHSPYLLHSQLLGYDLLRWVTKGVFVGERDFYLGIDQDDWFAPTDKWDAIVGGINGEYLMNSKDVLGVVSQQKKLRQSYPAAKNFAWTMAFNGSYANPNAKSDCSKGSLTSLTLCYKNEFLWINHTFTHNYMDFADYATAFSEIDNNTKLAVRLGLTTTAGYAKNGLVTGDVSGLGWYAPNGPDTGAKVDHGLEASNAEFLRAAQAAGVRYLASNMSTKSHEPKCWGCGITHPLNSSIFLVPRWPTNLFATPTTPVDMMDAYNRVYGPQGSDPYFENNLSYSEYLDVEAQIALYHLISGSPYQHYQHVGNLREYASGRSLAYDWVERLLSHYNRYYSRPIRTLNSDVVGDTVRNRTVFRNTNLAGVWDTATNRVSFTASNSGMLFVTGVQSTPIKQTIAARETKTFQLP